VAPPPLFGTRPAPHAASERIRVFLVDDSPVALLLLQRLLSLDGKIQVVGTARNGREAMVLLKASQPDVIITDYHMPVMDGLALVKAMMERFPRPILVVSSAVGADQEAAFALLQAGAVDLFPKPQGLGNMKEVSAQLAQKIHMLAGVVVISRRDLSTPAAFPATPGTDTPPARPAQPSNGNGASDTGACAPTTPGQTPGGATGASTTGASTWSAAAAGAAILAPAPRRGYLGRVVSAHSIAPRSVPSRVMAIGASTGGPQALQTIFSALPASFPCPILCVQHISHGFLDGLVEWLNRCCRLSVQVAEHGEKARAGVIYFAPQDKHLEIDARCCLLHSQAPPVDGHRPSVTALFDSVARSLGEQGVGVLLTGMGGDGGEGLLEMARRGAATIAQDEASSIIFGMPRQAIEIGAAQYVLPLDQVAPALERLALPPLPPALSPKK